MPHEPHDELDALLAARTGPSTADLDTPEINAALDALGERIVAGKTAGPSLRPRRRRAVIVAASAALAAALAVGVPAAADWIDLRTGQFGPPGTTEQDTSEYLRADSPEMAALVEEYGRDYPLPPGGDWSERLQVIRSYAGPGESGLIQETGVRLELAMESACQWQGYWLEGHDRGDAAQMAQAQRTLDDIPDWRVLRERSDDDGIYYLKIAKAARLGDEPSVRYLYDLNCSGKISPTGAPVTPDPSINAPDYLTDAERAGR
ncbi:hypothetical protein [Cryptosporangium aurantiacum]|uniref:Uncharacterized protein n=1 Tax=Cryptosporangium aurantiacum TaxID=134849 RepID=A0A1M7RM98_9ACTN|nr:hypothetical protein [Cryptosporangium aurantiacum]SHN47218.1 hypothetical protein SAMN05443668_12166 [Cryptosporangium aurantiacum]